MVWCVLVRRALYALNLTSLWSVLVANAIVVGLLLAGTTILGTETVSCRLGGRAAVGEGVGFSNDTVDFDAT